MHFSHQHQAHGSQVTKFAIVAGLHALLAVGIVNMLGTRDISPTELPNTELFVEPKLVDPPKPVDPPPKLQEIAPPTLVVPQILPIVEPPPVQDTVQATVQTEPWTEPPATTTTTTSTEPAKPVAKPTTGGGMRSAVLADANSCAKPNYPVQAARNGDSGTVVLALMVGANGRVTDARVTKTSGHRDLDRAAVNALSLCQFKPAMNDGVPEAGWAQIAYVWSLDE